VVDPEPGADGLVVQHLHERLDRLGLGPARRHAKLAREHPNEAGGPQPREVEVDDPGKASVELLPDGAKQGRLAGARLSGEEDVAIPRADRCEQRVLGSLEVRESEGSRGSVHARSSCESAARGAALTR